MRGFSYKNGELHCEGVAVTDLARDHGTPLYLYSKQALVENYREIDAAFSGVDHGVYFSVKSCSSLGVLNVLRQEGSGFDIVSGGELHRVLAVGADPSRIAFAGVGKTDAEIRYALESGIGLFNAESEAELDNIQAIAKALGKTARVGMRLNPDVDALTHAKTTTGKKENKFGIDFPTASRIAKGMAARPNLSLVGVDCHLGSPINSVKPYAEAMEKVAAFVRDHRTPLAPLDTIDIGGGFGLLYRDQETPTFVDFAAVIVPHVKAAGCRLITEPGRSIVGNAGVLLARVLYIKDNGHKLFTIVDAGMNDLVRPAMYGAYHFCWPTKYAGNPPSRLFAGEGADAYLEQEVRDGASRAEGADSAGFYATDVVGPICESSDAFAHHRRLPLMARGDLLAIFSAGAYSFSMSSHYNSRPLPAEVLVDGQTVKVIRGREDYRTLTANESF